MKYCKVPLRVQISDEISNSSSKTILVRKCITAGDQQE